MRLARSLALALFLLIAVIAVAVWLFLRGFVRFNYPSRADYPLQGVDISHHQRRIDWEKLRAEGYAFAFIKATEGGDYRDPLFAANWAAAERAGIVRGAYHFFTFCTAGEKQAANFLAVAPPAEGTLPPVVDVEYHGNCARPPAEDAIRAELAIFIERIVAAHGRRPIIYVTSRSYKELVASAFADYPIWARNIFLEPRLEGGAWSFWQYANRGRVDGVGGLVDLDAFRGSEEEFLACVMTEKCR
jgi:lysozyme